MIWFLVSRLASRPVLSVQFLRLVRFPRIGLRTGWRCAPFLSARFPHSLRSSSLVSVRHPLAAGSFSFRLVSLLVCPSRGASRVYPLRLAHRLVLLVNSPGGPLSRLVRRSVSRCSSRFPFFGVLSCSAHRFLSRSFVSPGRLVKQSVFSFRLGGSQGGSCPSVPRLVLFCSRLISIVASHGHDGGGSSFPCSLRRVLLPLPRRGHRSVR